MGPRFQTLRPAQTASAREAMRSFFCELCQKGYSRMNEYEAHLSSYDHSHKQRLKDMKAMVRDPAVTARARRLEARDDAVISIKLGGSAADDAGGPDGSAGGRSRASAASSSAAPKKGGFRKGGFKSAFVAATDDSAAAAEPRPQPQPSVPTIALPSTAAPPLSGSSAPSASAPTVVPLPPPQPLVGAHRRDPDEESDTDDEGYDMYDPRKPTD